MIHRFRMGRSRRRGWSLLESMSTLVIISTVGLPMVMAFIGAEQNKQQVVMRSDLQRDLDRTVWRLAFVLREATEIKEIGADSVHVVDPDGIEHKIYLEDGGIWETMGDESPIQLASNVTALSFSFSRTLAGALVASTDVSAVTAVKVELSMSTDGRERTGEVFITLRNRMGDRTPSTSS